MTDVCKERDNFTMVTFLTTENLSLDENKLQIRCVKGTEATTEATTEEWLCFLPSTYPQNRSDKSFGEQTILMFVNEVFPPLN